MCRPLVEWILGHLPAGGQAWEFPEWSQQQRIALVDDFIGSRCATQCRLPGDPPEVASIVVEIVLVDSA